MRPTLFKILGDVTECSLSKLMDNTKLGAVTEMPQDYDVIQNNLDRLEEWIERNS